MKKSFLPFPALCLPLLIAVGAAPACAGDEPTSGVARVGSPLEGIYEVTAYRRNEAGCSTPGPDALASLGQRYLRFTVSTDSFFGVDVTSARASSCNSVDLCSNPSDSEGMDFGYVFFEAKGQSLVAELSSGGSAGGDADTCNAAREVNTLTADREEPLRLTVETRRQEAVVGNDAEDFCDLDDPALAAAPCLELTVLEAVFVADL